MKRQSLLRTRMQTHQLMKKRETLFSVFSCCCIIRKRKAPHIRRGFLHHETGISASAASSVVSASGSETGASLSIRISLPLLYCDSSASMTS